MVVYASNLTTREAEELEDSLDHLQTPCLKNDQQMLARWLHRERRLLPRSEIPRTHTVKREN